MKDRRLPIGVFDSGMGGISVLKELISVMPKERYLYFGDSANAPYGTKSHDEIYSLTLAAVEKLRAQGIKALVVACNTATGVAVSALRENFSDMPIIGLEPALKPAVESGGKTIAVMATPATLHEDKFRDLYDRYKDLARIILIPAPRIVEFVEHGVFDGGELYEYLCGLFLPYRNEKIDSVVLGCTHFPFVREAICRAAGGCVRIFDGGHGAAAEAHRRLEATNLLTDMNEGGVEFENSIDSGEIKALAEMLFRR